MAACGTEAETSVTTGEHVPEPVATESATGASAGGLQEWTWAQVGCPRPDPTVPGEVEDALAQDAALAAPSLAEETGVELEEATRQMILQDQLRGLGDQVASADGHRIADRRWIYEPEYALQITLAGLEPPAESTQELLCSVRELRIRVGADHTTSELLAEAQRLGQMVRQDEMSRGLLSYGPQEFELVFDVADAETQAWLAALLAENARVPYRIESLALPPLEIDPDLKFPLLDITGHDMPDAGIGGTLTIEGPCAYVGEALMIMPARETTWDPATGILDMGQGPMRSGDEIFGGGSDYFGSLGDLDQLPDPSCRTDAVVLAVFGPTRS